MYGNLARSDGTGSASPDRQRKGWLGYKRAASERITDASASRATSISISREGPAWFQAWASLWAKETGHLSSLTSRREHPTYKKIVDLGSIAVPMILGELAARPDFWFSALREITGEDPVRDHFRGNFDAMRDAWLRWAEKKHIVPRDVRKAVP
jgi:hypothetical protein